jgi:hypothetical protein
VPAAKTLLFFSARAELNNRAVNGICLTGRAGGGYKRRKYPSARRRSETDRRRDTLTGPEGNSHISLPMRDKVDFTTMRMMTWRARAMVPTVVLQVLVLLPPALRLGEGWTEAFAANRNWD